VKLEWIGWVATAAFATSYLCRRPQSLRVVQALAALLWVLYGALIHALPVMVANIVVAGVAVWSSVARSEENSG
jgi:inner membrane protein